MEQIAALTSKDSKESKCVGDQTYEKCSAEHLECTGRGNAEAIYKFKSSAEESMYLLTKYFFVFRLFFCYALLRSLEPWVIEKP